ncbi:uncharacterized protein PV09_01493 [Verruconis gallopava]|uniref:Uncharacterized protein n=1 Tax=Verruconis gallopava TaxID=253628 RepID=A0A0D1XXR0_9PEZI|nr:uncharacterized protein PV09_01493 [Verruconis gallopava]KIW07531.1 hypothetical protein PV09_01493 [Verruconis gallopava]
MADDDLLARLNALKAPTEVPKVAQTSVPHPSIKATTADDDIASRFRRIATRSSVDSSPLPQVRDVTDQNKLEDVLASLPSERVHNVEDEQSLDDLLKELGEQEASWLNTSEEDRITDLLKEAKAALPRPDAAHDKKAHEEYEPAHLVDGAYVADEGDEQARNQDEQDEKDADEYIAQVMADIELQKAQGTYKEECDTDSEDGQAKEPEIGQPSETQTPARSAREATPFDDLPSAPSTAPVLASVEDDELEARFKSLSLPSTPSNKPTAKKPASTVKPKSNLPQYTDEDIESWCVICNEDATVRCLGCDGDLYCQACWNEGHKAPDAGYEERTHKAVVYNRRQGRKKSLAAA